MRMHVKAKKIAVAGLLAAFSAVLLMLSSVIETNSLFLIAAASFCVGIAFFEWGLRFGFGFLVSSLLVNFIVSPNKLYCITYAAMGLYLFFSEFWWKKLMESGKLQHFALKLYAGKLLVFNCMYIPALLFFQEILFAKEVKGILLFVFWVLGQVVLFVYELAYVQFLHRIWSKVRVKLMNS